MKEKVLNFVLVPATLCMSVENRKGLLKTLYEASLKGYTHAYRAEGYDSTGAGAWQHGGMVPIHDLTMALAATLDDATVVE